MRISDWSSDVCSSDLIQVRDLLIHNSGLGAGAGDLMLWPGPNHFTRADVIHGLRYLKPVYSFRSRYAYDNTLYIVAGEVARSEERRFGKGCVSPCISRWSRYL